MNLLVLPGDDIGPEITGVGTADLGGNLGTRAFGAAVVKQLEKSSSASRSHAYET